ncbi:MAG TPA: hypothetical protein VM307_11255 [Egibacteraceae bacterium]|nr:hypothetical protein [Egibacteraceae bacterium]
MYYELAWQMGCTVEELLDRVSSRELTGWRALFKVRDVERRREESRAKAAARSGRTGGARRARRVS